MISESMVQKRKLIEVALPLEAINRESAREKSIRHGHPSTLHIWWARRPLAAARAILFAQLVDDPSSHPEEFPTEELQREERNRLHGLIERLVVWENTRDEKLLAEAHKEILKSTNGKPPPIFDPFAGGGTIPLEALRLGLDARASDLNPVAVLINKALIEIPQKFRGRPPVYPGLAESEIRDWKGAEGLAADVRAYGTWMLEEAQEQIGEMYPNATLDTGSEAPVLAWIWARTVACPNPACGIHMPLVRSWWLGNKKGKEAYIVPTIVSDPAAPGGRRVRFVVRNDPARGPTATEDGTVARTAATCVACKSSVPLRYVRSEGREGRLGTELMTVVAEGPRRRIYLAPSDLQTKAANIERPESTPVGSLPPHGLSPANPQTVRIYGFDDWGDLFTNRQLVSLTTFCDLVIKARARVLDETQDSAYADAVATYLAFIPSALANLSSMFTTWRVPAESPRTTFSRQAISMAWDFVESHPLEKASGAIDRISLAVQGVPMGRGTARQADASRAIEGHCLISTDPPYYDNIGYSDLSDYFYVWLRRSLREVHPELFSTVLVPKAEELVANPHRHGDKKKAKDFFEDGFRMVFKTARDVALKEYPITVYYAFKQSESDALGEASTGWETLLEGMVSSGWEITSTWPVRTEASGRMISVSANALASSIVLSLRPRQHDAPTIDRRELISALESELPQAVRNLQHGMIAPVDLPQAAIGPGMGVYSRFSAVLEPDGTRMSVRSALARINEILDQVLNEQEGDFDSTSRFAIAWYRQHGYGTGHFGDADNLARARNTSVEAMERGGVLASRAGKVQLIRPSDLRTDYDIIADLHTSNWEVLHHLIGLLETDGITKAGDMLRDALSRPDGAVEGDLIKELAHLLFRIAESNGWTKDALSFNNLVTSWPEIMETARSDAPSSSMQAGFDFDTEES